MGFLDWLTQEEADESLSIPQDDVERWVTTSYALWSEWCGGSFHLIGGYLKNRQNSKLLRGVLQEDWGIHNRADGLRTIGYLTPNDTDIDLMRQTAGWDLCRATQLLGMYYVAGYLTRAEAMEQSCRVGERMQLYFDSWEELCESYLAGFALWKKETSLDPPAEIQERIDLYQALHALPDGPYHISWKLKLTPRLQEAVDQA